MLGNSSNKRSKVLPKHGSLTLSFVRLGFQIKTKNPQQQQANKCLLMLDTVAINARYSRSVEEDVGN